MSNPYPQGPSKWRHKGNGRVVTFLTIAHGTAPDQGVDFAYFLAPTKSGALKALVMRMDVWHEVMEKLEDAPSDSS